MNRAEKRRQEKESRKGEGAKLDGEITKAELEAAEQELKGGVSALESSTYDRFAAQFALWSQSEVNRLTAEEQYRLTFELPGMAREQVTQQYARAKKTMLLLEKRMAQTLTDALDEEKNNILYRRFSVLGGFAQLPETLSSRLEALLDGRVDEPQSDKDG